MTESLKVIKLQSMRQKAQLGGGLDRIQKQHASKKMTARERVMALLDPGSFNEIDAFKTSPNEQGDDILGEGVVAGWGNVNGRLTYVYAQDFTVVGGTLSWAHGMKICKVMDLAMENGAPIIAICDSGGARIQQGVLSLGGYGEIFYRNTMASGVIPQLSAIMGPTAGGSCYSPGLTDFIFMVKDSSYLFITGPQVVKAVTFKDIDFESLGGARMHTATSGVAHFAASNEQEGFMMMRQLLSYVPQNNRENPPYVEPTDDPKRLVEELNHLVPDSTRKPYDMKAAILGIVDDREFFEIQPKYAPNMIIGFARLNGHSIGIVANQPTKLAGTLDNKASMKAARFIRFCDCFNIPIITFEDVPGFLPGEDQEREGIIKNGAKLLYAYCEATVPRITVICRKAYGGAYIVMNSRHIRGDYVLAWPDAEIAVMGPEAAVNIINRKQIEQASDREALRGELIAEYVDKFASPYTAAAEGFVDDVIEPRETRAKLISVLEMLKNKHKTLPYKKHGNIPL